MKNESKKRACDNFAALFAALKEELRDIEHEISALTERNLLSAFSRNIEHFATGRF